MSLEIVWDSVPAKRQRKTEKYTTPVLTFVAVDQEKKGAARKMIFNKAAQEALNIQGEDRVSFGWNTATKQVFVRKATAPSGIELTKTCTLSDKKTFESILSAFGLSEEVENEFDLYPSDLGSTIFEVVVKSPAESNFEFAVRNLGEVSDVEDMSGNTDSIPATPEGGAMYSEAEEVVEVEEPSMNEEEAPLSAPATPEMVTEGSEDNDDEEEVW